MSLSARINALYNDMASDGLKCPDIGEMLIFEGARILLCSECQTPEIDIVARVRDVLLQVAHERAVTAAKNSKATARNAELKRRRGRR